MTQPEPRNPKSSWPLLVLAALSFIPLFGFILAAVALTWALLSDRPRARLAGILAAVAALLQVGGMTIFTMKQMHSKEFTESDVRMAHQDVDRIALELEKYHAREGSYPGSLEVLTGYPIPHILINIRDIHHGIMLAGPDYPYQVAGDSQSYGLFGRGADNQPGTADDIRPVLPDSLRQRAGYRPER